MYNYLKGAKFYYESKNKDLLPQDFKFMWAWWHNSQTILLGESLVNRHMATSFNHFPNFFKAENAYFELNDNLLIIGLGLLCRHYIYTKLLEESWQNIYISRMDFLAHAQQLYDEALKKYYPFFQHYNWHCKKYILEHYTKEELCSWTSIHELREKYLETMPYLDDKFDYLFD